ncbi:fibrous sheath-interacting protein 2-like [Salvelinus fontinalis]|uniref:fibrous sheath-interacting protein 2-like n=1 Tax=Salvelinus fontinalis TaxID=8038 RepID=UPI002485B71C|nr:fibrous sheath-interacting protein 2-like [Salvelinus fontinalis]
MDDDEARKGLQEAPERTFPVFFRGKLGAKLHQETPGFDLLDPNMRVIDVSYNCLHDKHLKCFFRHPERKKRLVKQGLITSNEKAWQTSFFFPKSKSDTYMELRKLDRCKQYDG